jgi:ABC-type nitrate/sulfonate/bicarbonate transport system ATPase subunit
MLTRPGAPATEPLADVTQRAGDEADARISLSAAHAYGEVAALGPLALEVASGEVVGLVGPSGCGKSTLLELVAGLLEPSSGSVSVGGGAAPEARLARCAYMPQRDLLLPWYSAIDNAALALRNGGAGRAEARRRAHALFERFGLAGFETAPPAELSGGMRQRVAFLRTLLAGKPVLLLDEPFASLDALTRGDMQEWLALALNEERRTTVLVTHDVEEALYLSDRVVVLSPRPGRAVDELSPPDPRAPGRDDAVLADDFVAARERAMHSLRGGSR